MADHKKDQMDSLIDFILSGEEHVNPDDQDNLNMFNDAIAAGEKKLARARLERAKAGSSLKQGASATVLDLENARRLLARAKAGDTSAQVTLAARFGDGTMDADLDAIAEDIAELEAEVRDEED
ncbi:hypothetical protein IC608_11200 [Devosia sp. PTR5]|uniref:Uncharacterized protein n=1 Tax=Devosia oryzisoli TaxID=2774138 RepID=A0A927FWP8_9HYPH|nr:hypothetical protein [Devosia oryzisoli]MBD8066039.1 hypothetical protein [Devosia oryzisoli]